MTSAQRLPHYCAMLAVDVKDFSARPGRVQPELSAQVPQILAAAFSRAGLADEWAAQSFPRSTGDGYVAGFRTEILPFLVNPVVTSLECELAERSRSRPDEMPIRMRVGVAVGPVTGTADGDGDARIELHRLLDSEPVRHHLDSAGPETHVAVIISRRVYEDAVVSGYSGDGVDYYAPVTVTVKSFRGEAYLRVPTGQRPGGGTEPSTPPSEPGPTIGTYVGTSNAPMHTGTGDQYFGSGPGRDRG